MRLIKNFDIYNIYFDLDISQPIKSDEILNFIGWYKVIDNKMSGFIIKEAKIYFFWDDFEVVLNDRIRASVNHLSEDHFIFKIYNENGVIKAIQYDADKSLDGIPPFEYIDEEDFDWGLFLANIINDPERQKNLINSHTY